jgi:signal transduction histidine kinase/CheY-like chemotaxis protein
MTLPLPKTGVLQAATLQWLEQLAAQGVFATDAALTVCSWNHWLEQATGRMAADVIGRHLFQVFPELTARGIDMHYHAALAGEVRVLAYSFHRYVLPARVGIAEPAQSARIAPLQVDGETIGTITVIDDVGDRVASERELRRQIQAAEYARGIAEEAVRTKDEFLATLSHEIRTPLNAVIGWTKILRSREVEPAMLNRALEVIDRNATSQLHLIDDMLDMARIMSGKLRIESETVDFAAVVLAAVDVVMPSAVARGLSIYTHLEEGPHHVSGDADRLQQVIWNLLSNAVKFTDAGGEVRITLTRENQAVRVSVSDTGAGIPPDFIPYMFDRFRQAHASASRRQGGLGLGLPLVRQLVELHGGTVTASSVAGSGSTFTVTLPALGAPARRAEPGPQDAVAESLEGIRVLVVEDHADARELMVAALEHCGAIVQQAGTAAEALRAVDASLDARTPFRVIVSDLGLPEEDGFQLMTLLRQRPDGRGGDIPVIAVTAYAAPNARKLALAAGFRAHLVKPVDISVLTAALRSVLAPRPDQR